MCIQEKKGIENSYHKIPLQKCDINYERLHFFCFKTRQQAGAPAKCPLDPYFIIPDKCRCVDFQVLKLQELPDNIPQGEMPRHLQLYCDRYLCERVVPGNRVLILGIYSIKKIGRSAGRQGGKDRAAIGVRSPYVRVVGISVDGDNTGSGQ